MVRWESATPILLAEIHGGILLATDAALREHGNVRGLKFPRRAFVSRLLPASRLEPPFRDRSAMENGSRSHG